MHKALQKSMHIHTAQIGREDHQNPPPIINCITQNTKSIKSKTARSLALTLKLFLKDGDVCLWSNLSVYHFWSNLQADVHKTTYCHMKIWTVIIKNNQSTRQRNKWNGPGKTDTQRNHKHTQFRIFGWQKLKQEQSFWKIKNVSENEGGRERERESERDWEKERERERERDRDRDRERQRETDRQTDRQADRQTAIFCLDLHS